LRVTNTPEEFLEPPRVGKTGAVHVDAVVADLCRALGHAPPAERLDRLLEQGTPPSLALTLLLCWVLAEEAIRPQGLTAELLLDVLDQGARELSQHTTASTFV